MPSPRAQEAQLTKNPATSKHFAMVWKALPDGHEGVLAGIIQELAADAQRLGMIHQILKRVLRGCYPKFNLLRFCKPMLERAEDILAALRGTSDLNPAVRDAVCVCRRPLLLLRLSRQTCCTPENGPDMPLPPGRGTEFHWESEPRAACSSVTSAFIASRTQQ